MTNYFVLAHNILFRLCKEFDVDVPLLIADGEYCDDCDACYFAYEIHIHPKTLKNLERTVICVRHEFAHYIQDLKGIEKRIERQAKRFEKKTSALGIVPKSQKILTDFQTKLNCKPK